MKILIPVDGSKISEKIVEAAKKIGEKFDAELILLNVINDTNLHSEYYSQELYNFEFTQSKQILENAKKFLLDYPYKVSTVSKEGTTYLEIINLADEEDVDLIVVGNRGLGVFSRTLLGSVSNKVLNHAEKAVLVIKAELEED
ncbi:Nucleotide-binding universal stress protein, UspA family [Anaerosphaera aminiphila DSM 21120]|uniref:Universal stress protein n=1 Tax=Anaerosphaera aminiphila DSM 21120 TaxID=1120995 RepID=A0A1M5TAR1_9FIRM|nr:universal stress protein [Anaerosphaera aminiphila]SHH47804.1 Nucleotide-binding universal stress protein, UspA family [Anaerosphaera aminiphila DSM 21120]